MKNVLFILLFNLTFYLVSSGQNLELNTQEQYFYSDLTIHEKVDFLLPDTVYTDSLTEWDWIETQPYTEKLRMQNVTNHNLERFSRITTLYTDRGNDWDYAVDYVFVSPDSSLMYGPGGEVLSALPHGSVYKAEQDSLQQKLIENGLFPTLPFPAYNELPLNDLQEAGFQVQQNAEGYRIWNAYEESFVNPAEHTVNTRSLQEVYDQPYHTYKSYQLTSQGYLAPVLKMSFTRLLSEKGHCIIKRKVKSYSNQQLYYDPALVYETQPYESVAQDFNVFPNPVQDYMKIQYTGTDYTNNDYTVEVINGSNVTVAQYTSLNTSLVENLASGAIDPGFYTLRFTLNQMVFTKKILKN
ncbi:MAG: T9SS type A sorting domain-containing protein [Owenweeksia sp.]